ncbi:Dyp-type peroxidase [Ramlibacter sp. AN1133]|uniref:Dyp-type peroxidase n=1 Tax=Ramlibacter sp. AN1133 TaxID=3133429 RepID=UPI0030BC2B23
MDGKATARKAPAGRSAARGGAVRQAAIGKAAIGKAAAEPLRGKPVSLEAVRPAAKGDEEARPPSKAKADRKRPGDRSPTRPGKPGSQGGTGGAQARADQPTVAPYEPRPRRRATGLRGVTNLAVLAPVREGLVKSFEPISYVERLRKVLDALQSARQNLRESELLPSFFVDTVARLDIIHHFRYALVKPQAAGSPWQLSLNVTFDGGWEPYMRVIYRDIGPLLDLLFCHNDTYPGSRTSTFEKYCDWVRTNEIEAGLFYAEAATTLQDQRYLAEVERTQRERGGCERDLARLALPSSCAQQEAALARAMADPLRALVLPLRTLKGLYRLSLYFPPDPAGHHAKDDLAILRRFAQSVLAESMQVMRALDALPAGTPQARVWQENRTVTFRDELDWLEYDKVAPEVAPPPVPCDPARLQSHILASAQEQVTHGCVVLLRVRNADDALAEIARLAPYCDAAHGGPVRYLVAFTYAGLRQLGLPPQRLDAFPQEFYEGMEARSALLGDLRGNHPDRWTRPLLWKQQAAQRVDLNAVHVVIHLRLQDAQDPGYALHKDFEPLVAALDASTTGLRVLAVEPLRTYRSNGYVSGHMNVADGISQPEVPTGAPPRPRSVYQDLVSTGELVLGYGNDRGDQAGGVAPLLQDGSFLVVRKLRQRMDHLQEAMAQLEPRQRDELLARMVGRRRDGTPLAPLPPGATDKNDFDYADQAASDACPFHSHIRRTNPRDGRAYTPRILRRGMSYGPLPTPISGAADRGVMFMAYCASIAEQFETIQRWVAGGNSSGVGSAQGDPLLRVPQEGESNTFRFLDSAGQVVRVAFGDKPLVELQWGLYLFVPSLPVLAQLAAFRAEPAAPPAPPAAAPMDRLEQMRQVIEDRDRSKAVWEKIRAGEYQGTPYGRLVGTLSGVLEAMNDQGDHYSVQGYGRRMAASLGQNILGMDPGPARSAQLVVNKVIESVSEKDAFELTLRIVAKVLEGCPELPRSAGDIVRKPVDLVNFSDVVLATLCRIWFGLPQDPDPEKVPNPVMVAGGRLPDDTTPARCPGHFLSASRYIFSPHPRPDVEHAGQAQGKTALAAVQQWLQGKPDLAAAPLTAAILKGLTASGYESTLAVNIAGVLLGFPPTVQPNFLRVMEKWVKEEASLWERQQDLFEASPARDLSYDQAAAALRKPLFAAMRKDPVPGMLWRCPAHGKDAVDFSPERQVVLGMGSALTDAAAPDELVFGRDERTGTNTTVHGCPGYHMAMGVLLGMIAGLMKAGTLRPTGSPVLLILTPNT